MLKRLGRAIKIVSILTMLPASMVHAQEEDSSAAESAGESTPNQIQITNNSSNTWTLSVSSSTSGEHKFIKFKKDLDFSAMKLKDTATRKELSSTSKFTLAEDKTYTLTTAKPGKKYAVVHFTIEDEGKKNKATFCLFNKESAMRLFVEKVEFSDDMDIEGVLDINKPGAGGLVIHDKPKPPK